MSFVIQKGAIMSENMLISFRVKPELKKKADIIFNTLGITKTEAFNMFLSQVILNNGLPFEVKIPSDSLRESIEDIKSGKNLTSYDGQDYLTMMRKKLKK